MVTIGGLTYATFMTLYIVPVLYDIFFRRELRMVAVDDEETMRAENIVLQIDDASAEKQEMKKEPEDLGEPEDLDDSEDPEE